MSDDVNLGWSAGLVAGIGSGEVAHHWHSGQGVWHGGWTGVACMAIGVGIYLALWWRNRHD